MIALEFIGGIVLWLGFLAFVVWILGRSERARVRERRRGGADLHAAKRLRW